MSEYLGEKIYLGENVADLNIQKPFEQYSKVIFNFENNDGENSYVEAGSDGGQVLELTIQALTDSTYAQEIAENVLNVLKTKDHKPYDATDAMLDPAFELGDAVTLPELYTVIGSSDEICDSLYSASISAKGRDETEDEFIYKTQSDKNIQRQLAKTRASLRIDVDRIALEVSGKIDGDEARTLIDQTLKEITLTVSGTNGTTTFQLQQGITILDTETFDLHVKSVNIEGTLTADEIRGSVFELLDDGGNIASTFYLTGASSYDGRKIVMKSGAIEISALSGDLYLSGRNGLSALDFGSVEIGCMGTFFPNSDGIYNLGGSSFRWGNIYAASGTIQTSDANKKKDISHDIDDMDAFFDDLKPVSYKFVDGRSGRTHYGLIAQEVEASLLSIGKTTQDFGGICKDKNKNGLVNYALRYDEFISLCIDQIQKLKARVSELEHRTAS